MVKCLRSMSDIFATESVPCNVWYLVFNAVRAALAVKLVKLGIVSSISLILAL